MSPEEKKKDDEQKNEQKLHDAMVENAPTPAAFGTATATGFGAPTADMNRGQRDGGFGRASASGGMFGNGPAAGSMGFGAPKPPSPEQKLHDAIVENDLVSVTALLDGGADVNDFKSVLQPACEWDRVEMLQLFDARGADLLNAGSAGSAGASAGGFSFGGTCGAVVKRDNLLHVCSGYGAVKCAKFLLSKGIDHNKKTETGYTSLDICRMNGQCKPAKRDGGDFSNNQASEPSPGRKEIEKLILSKMKSEEHYSQKT
jgi:hypothetical protein